MYPNEYFNLFPAFPRNRKVFVAMSFNKIFSKSWDIISEAVKRVSIGEEMLEPYRVDIGQSGDSIQTEILKEISNSLLIIGEITTLGKIENIPVRNSNVLYEIGIAHAVRIPEEVLLFRYDNDQIPFDVTNIRVRTYNVDDKEESIKLIGNTIVDALKEVENKKRIIVQKIAQRLDFQSVLLLASISSNPITHPEIRTMRDVMSKSREINSINRLLDLGLIESELHISQLLVKNVNSNTPAEQIISYKITNIGKEVVLTFRDKFDDKTVALFLDSK